MAKQQTGTTIRSRQDVRLDEPRRYKVIFHNDDFTTMDFVVMVLKTVFFKSDAEAETLMLKVHRQGKGVAGIYARDIAMSKTQKALQMARAKNYPLRITCEPEEL